ncbi:uncharacterized protein LOC143230933 [Tachypleus tridentatus]|uniref:uncharacterized protein LOC143230933 n=1 Tax=Tachypleus tridentatus TaxID=6853 RepID=UPI003FD40F1F
MGFAKKLVLKKDAVPSVYPKCEGDPSSTASSRGTSHSCSQTDDSHGQSAVQIRRVYRKPYLRINLEQSGDSPQDGIISKFSESDGEVQDCSEHDVVKIKNEADPKKYVDPGSEVLSGEYKHVNKYIH